MSESKIPEELVLQLTGLLSGDETFFRRPLLEDVLTTLPKEAEARLLVYHGESLPGVKVPWHFHNGPLVSILLQGEIIIQFGEDDAYYYRAGDVFVEPVGVVHRAYNPNPEVPIAALAMQFTPSGQEHIVTVASGPTEQQPTTAPHGPTQPRPRAQL